MRRKIVGVLVAAVLTVNLIGCAALESKVDDIEGQLKGNSFECEFYNNSGEKYLTVSGDKIGMKGNVVEEAAISSSDGSQSKEYSLSSIITINIDGKQIQSCGDTIIFQEDGLLPDAEYEINDIESKSSGSIEENTIFSGIVNSYKNLYGKPLVVVIQSQLGVPICAYSGNDVYWEVREDLPKTTKLMIDDKALYIHRANFQIIDKSLL